MLYQQVSALVGSQIFFVHLFSCLCFAAQSPIPTEPLVSIHPDDTRTDAQLIAATGQCDYSAFDKLYARHEQWVYRLAYRLTGNDADAWDVHQETFMYLAARAGAMTLTCSLRTLLFTVIRRLAIKANKKRRRLVLGDELLAALPAKSVSGENDDLLAVLQSLDLAHRQVVILRYIDDLGINEIAEVLGIPAGTVKSRLFNAHRQLRDNPGAARYFKP